MKGTTLCLMSEIFTCFLPSSEHPTPRPACPTTAAETLSSFFCFFLVQPPSLSSLSPCSARPTTFSKGHGRGSYRGRPPLLSSPPARPCIAVMVGRVLEIRSWHACQASFSRTPKGLAPVISDGKCLGKVGWRIRNPRN